MKLSKPSLLNLSWSLLAAAAALAWAGPASAQLIAYDDAGNYQVSANWTNGANQGVGFTPWAITTNGPDSHGTYVGTANNPMFVIASVTNVLGTNYTAVWGTYANGTNGQNSTVAYRGFANPLSTNTFKLQWGSRGAGVTTVGGLPVHGYCGFALRNGNVTDTAGDYDTGTRLDVFFYDGNSPATIYVSDSSLAPHSLPGTSFSDLGRNNITNAVQVEITVGADGDSYHLVLKDCVQNRTLATLDGTLAGSGTIDSVALVCNETTGDQVYNRMQIAIPHVAPTIVNVQPTNGSIYLDPSATSLTFEVDSFNSTVAASHVSVSLNGMLQSSVSYNTTDPTRLLQGTVAATLAPDSFYDFVIVAQDANGNLVTNSSTFNTFLASDFYIDAADYNYGSGQYFGGATPVNAYANLLGTNGIDYLETDLAGTNNLYRPGDLPQVLSLATDATGDPIDHAGERAAGWTVYNIGFTDVGEWQNYTRTVPSPTNYSLYARAASGGGGQFEIEALVNATATVSNQPFAALGRVNVPVTGGSRVFSGQLMPLTDIYGNTVVVPLSGTKTIRCTALSSRGYNLEYLLLVEVTNATSTLRPYIAAGSPAANATGVALASPITFTIANRQTTVNTGTIKVYTNSVNVTTGIVLSNNAAGTVVTYTPTSNFAPNSTTTISVTFTDSGSVNLSNSWSFVTASTGGTPGNGLWSAGGGFDLNWSTAANWTGGTPGLGNTATFASAGGTTTLVTNNIVSTNVTIAGLFYNTNNSGYHTTWIQDGVTLTVTNGATGTVPVLQVGGLYNSDNSFNKQVTNTITGAGGTLLVQGNPAGSGLGNSLNFQIRQCANPAVPEQVVLDMSGLGTLVATVGKFYLAQGGSGNYQSNVSARVSLARTNIITMLRPNAGQFEVGDSSGGAFTLPGSTLNLGITNAFFVDTARFGKQKATNNLVRFNPAFTSASPVAFFRGTNGLASRVTTWSIGDVDTEATYLPAYASATIDFSSGKLDALVNTLSVGRSGTAAGDTGFAQGTLTTAGGTLDVNTLQIGLQRAVNTATEAGTVNILGTATLVSPSITLATSFAGANASFVTGTLNVTNGTVRGTIVAGGGISTVNVNAGTLTVTGAVGTPASQLTALNLRNASVHLSVDGTATAAIINAAAVSAAGTTITIDSVANVAGPHTIHLIGYSGPSPFAGLSLAPLPAGYSGSLVDNSGSIDLSVSVATTPHSPAIHGIILSAGQLIISGTNNAGTGGGTYHVLTSTNVTLPLTHWSLLTNGSFDASGNFSSTNPVTGNLRFYLLQVP